MSELRAFEEDDTFDLRHYASQYYDPAKAREYYLRTRELKGRESGEKLSAESRQKQSEATSYVRKQISTQRTATSKAMSTAQTARLKKLQQTAKETRERITTKLNDLVKKLNADHEAKTTAIAEKAKADIEKLMAAVETAVPKPKLNEIPASASPRRRAFLEKQNARLMDAYNSKHQKATKDARDKASTIRATARTDIQKATESARSSSTKARESARSEVLKVGTSLKEAVTKARADYKTKREAVTAKYSADLKTELQNIEDQVR